MNATVDMVCGDDELDFQVGRGTQSIDLWIRVDANKDRRAVKITKGDKSAQL